MFFYLAGYEHKREKTMIIYGVRPICIKKYIDRHIKCEECGGYTHKLRVYKDCFHVFFIPFFPVGVKTITSHCCQCNYALNSGKREFYLNQTRNPLYMFSGLFLIAALIIALVFNDLQEQKLSKEYLADPAVGDVYLIYENSDKVKGYYFLKVFDIHEDTVFLRTNRLVYSSYISKFNEADYFNLEYAGYNLKSELEGLMEEGLIKNVYRNYDPETRFSVERYASEFEPIQEITEEYKIEMEGQNFPDTSL